MLKISDFDYSLPKKLIAQYPLKERQMARLLVLNRKEKTITHRIFQDIVHYFKKDDLLVLNDTKVLPVRLRGSRLTGGKVEVLLLKQKRDSTFNAFIKPARVKLGEKIIFDGAKIYGVIKARNEISFNIKNINEIYNLGMMPLPPYIKRVPEELDNIYYQTVYAREKGAIAAPTAGLHFSQDLLSEIKSCGLNLAYITLHVGEATFRPIKVNDITKHRMEPEYFNIPGVTKKLIQRTQQVRGRIFAVGTTTLRTLETYASGLSKGKTDLFIYPGYRFKITDCLLTNFHLPRTTLFMLVCAFGGVNLIRQAYKEAIAKEYRFYSYGDAMLIL